ncbi:hypothetical protein [Pseudonocardia xishanensis]|uniref:Mutator family transposase n=1 Tax=Pseudonocardia xishanensis TaxID=630995 RepID=A0ABP8RWZ4_9PSEU
MSQDTSTEDHAAEAARRLAGALDPSVIDALLADAKITGTPIEGVDGLLNRMTKSVIERVVHYADLPIMPIRYKGCGLARSA